MTEFEKSKGLDEERTLAQATRAIVVGPYLNERAQRYADHTADKTAKPSNARAPEARIIEAAGLAAAIDLDIIDSRVALLTQIRPATYLGKGKVDEIAAYVEDNDIHLVMMDCALSPVQQRNLEKEFKCKVIDRSAVCAG